MTRRREPGKPPGDYTVGYGRPPVATRFQPGQSGNPRGRPKDVEQPAAILSRLLNKQVTLQVNGRKQRMTMQELILTNVVNNAARGDFKAVQLLQTVLQRFAASEQVDANPEPDGLTPEDEALLADLVHRHGGTWPSDETTTAATDMTDQDAEQPSNISEDPV